MVAETSKSDDNILRSLERRYMELLEKRIKDLETLVEDRNDAGNRPGQDSNKGKGSQPISSV